MVSKTKISFALLRTSILCIPGVIDSYAAQNFRGLDRSCGRRREAVNLTHLFLSLFFCFLMLTVFYFTSSSDVCIHNFIDRFNQYEMFYEDFVLRGPRTSQYSPISGEGRFLIYLRFM